MRHEHYEGWVEHMIAEFRSAYPDLGHAGVSSEESNDAEPAFSVRLDLRFPQRQLLVSGPLRGDFHAAARAAFGIARARLGR